MDKEQESKEKINKEALNRNMKVQYSTLKRFREHKPFQSMTDNEAMNVMLDTLDAKQRSLLERIKGKK